MQNENGKQSEKNQIIIHFPEKVITITTEISIDELIEAFATDIIRISDYITGDEYIILVDKVMFVEIKKIESITEKSHDEKIVQE